MNKLISIKEVEDNNGRRNHKSPDAFRTISEVASELSVPLHVLRFWETKFAQLRPMKRAGGRRYYRPEDIALLKKIQSLLYDDGYTIKGVQKLLRDNSKKLNIKATGRSKTQRGSLNSSQLIKSGSRVLNEDNTSELFLVLKELEELREILKG